MAPRPVRLLRHRGGAHPRALRAGGRGSAWRSSIGARFSRGTCSSSRASTRRRWSISPWRDDRALRPRPGALRRAGARPRCGRFVRGDEQSDQPERSPRARPRGAASARRRAAWILLAAASLCERRRSGRGGRQAQGRAVAMKMYAARMRRGRPPASESSRGCVRATRVGPPEALCEAVFPGRADRIGACFMHGPMLFGRLRVPLDREPSREERGVDPVRRPRGPVDTWRNAPPSSFARPTRRNAKTSTRASSVSTETSSTNRRATDDLELGEDLIRLGEAVLGVLGEDELLAVVDVEDPVRALDELRVEALRLLDFGGQPDRVAFRSLKPCSRRCGCGRS